MILSRRFAALLSSALLLACLLAAPAAAAATSTAAAPAAAPAKTQDPRIPFVRYQLPNGLEVILVEDHSTPIVAVDVWYHVGSGDEVPGRSGFAHLFEHMMFQGTRNTGEDKHFEILQEIGATDVNGSTNSNRTNYYEVVPSNQLEVALWLESERMGYLPETITEKSLDNQREVVRNERRQNYDNVPYGKELFATYEQLYPEGHPYRHLTIGRHEDLAAASAEDVKSFFRKWYVPANATLTLVGDVDEATARKLVDKWFGSFPTTTKPVAKKVPAPVISAAKSVTVTDNLAKLRRLHYAWHTPALLAPGDAELDIVASALGQQGTGRLYKTLVLEKRWAQTVAVFQASAQLSSIFHVRIDLLDDAPLDEVKKIVDAELARVTSEPISEAELHRAVVGFESSYVWGLEPVLARAETLQNYNHLTGNPDGITRDLDRYRNATLAGVREVAAKFLSPSARVEVVTMPGAAPGGAAPGGEAQSAAAAPAEAVTPPKAATGGSVVPADEAALPPLTFPNEPFRAQRPTVSAAKPLNTPGIQRFKVGDGIDVFLVERHELPTVSLDLAFPGGAINDPAGRDGQSGLCMNLLDDGTEALDKVAFEEALADIASSVGSWAGNEQQGLSAATLSKHLGRTLDLWADTLLHPGLRAADHERNVRRQVAAVRESKAAPATIGRRVSGPLFYGEEHPLGNVVTEASTQLVGLDDCKRYVADYLKPQGAQLYVVGDVTRAQVEAEIGRRLATWKGAPKASATVPAPKPTEAAFYFVDVPGAPQSYIVMAEPGPQRLAPDYTPTSVMAGILGGDFSSRINMNIREDKGWAYGAGAGIRYSKTTGMVRAAASVRADATTGSILELYREIKRITEAPVTAAELQREKNGQILALPAQFATGQGILGSYRDLVFFGLPFDYYNTVVQKIDAVTVEQVAQAAQQHLSPADLRILVVGDGKIVRDAYAEISKSGELGQRKLIELDADGNPVVAAGAAAAGAS